MIAIDNALISDKVVTDQFVCDLNSCKGGCCVDGDAGAPLTRQELKELDKIYKTIEPYLRKEGIDEIKKFGKYIYDSEFGWVTPTINGKICVYGIIDEKGIVKCGIEQAWMEGKIKFKKPISCHLFPILVSNSKDGKTTFVNYEPRTDLCKPACALGKKLKVPVYEFLKEPIIRRFGESFYQNLKATAEYLKKQKNEG
jgi:hypothetical protein